MSMQEPPEGTYPVTANTAPPLVAMGAEGGVFAKTIPLHVDRDLVVAGQRHFETLCATCHGVLGDGVSAVAEKMSLRRPPSLLTPEMRTYAPGRIYRAIREGYGLMPSYRGELSIDEAWGVVAYVGALWLARGTRAAELPADVRAELAKEAP